MYIHDGHHMSDAWYCVDRGADRVHMFYLAHPLGTDEPTFVGHAVSADLVTWETRPVALRRGPRGAWDDIKLCTGSVLEYRGRYWMAYSATGSRDSSAAEPYRVQRCGLAVSDDLETWERRPQNPVSEAGPPFYECMSTGERQMVHWRDPFLFEHEGTVYHLTCARRCDGDGDTRGAAALVRGSDRREWEVLAPLEHDRVSQEMEVPQIRRIDGRWYLAFCTLGRFLAPDFARRFGSALPERSNFAMVGDTALGPYRIHGTGQIVQHGWDEYFYAAQLVEFRGRWYLLATVHDGDGERISDPVPVRGDDTGIHPCT